MADRLCTKFSQIPVEADGQAISVTASFGVAGLTLHGSDDGDFQACCRLADQALYSAKQNGRNRVVLASPLP